MKPSEFEELLDLLVKQLTAEAAQQPFQQSKPFENRVRTCLQEVGAAQAVDIELEPAAQAFPDIVFEDFGIEVKFTTNDTWRSIANSVFEGTRDAGVEHIYLVFGKMGGVPEVKWAKYDQSIVHVRTSHVPRFEVEIGSERSLFKTMGVSYEHFRGLSEEEKMHHVRSYARSRLQRGERLWWLEEKAEQEHSLPLQVKLYMNLPQTEKRRLRAECALLCPKIVKGSRSRDKYHDVTLYALTYRGILCPQARDLFSAGSVALRANEERGGNYILRALQDIQEEIGRAAWELEGSLFEEYWGKAPPPEQRISYWLSLLDRYAEGWTPSEHLFKKS